MTEQERDQKPEKLSTCRIREGPSPLAEKRAERIALLHRLMDRFNFGVPLGTLQRAHYRE